MSRLLTMIALSLSAACVGETSSVSAGPDDRAPICRPGRVVCGRDCVDLRTDPLHCGVCENTCASGETCLDESCELSCPAGQVGCDGRCVDPLTDYRYCGASGDCTDARAGMVCPPGERCEGGACALSCPEGQRPCEGRCVDIDGDPCDAGDDPS